MRMWIGICTLWLTLLAAANAGDDDYKLFCYYTDYSAYRSGSGNYEISNINTSLCTHFIYSMVSMTADGNISSLYPEMDLSEDDGKDGFRKFTALNDDDTGITMMVSIGWWAQGADNFSIVVNDDDLRATFVKNAVEFLEYYGFEGLDIDWEYPAQSGGSESDVQSFVLLLEELREAFETRGFLLTVAAGAGATTTAISYNVSGIANAVDYINLVATDYHNITDTVTGHNAPLYAATSETTASELAKNVNASVHNWISLGAPASKIILGTASYGLTFTLTDTSLHVPGSPASGAGTAGVYTEEAGSLAYFEICPSNWTVVYDEVQRVPYAYSGNQWVSYDNVESIKEKVTYLKSMGLAGAMIWATDLDDFTGLCGTEYPLLTTLYDELLA